MVARTPDANPLERELTTDLNDLTPDPPHGRPLHTRILLGLAAGAVLGVGANAWLGATDPSLVWFVRNFTEPIGQLFLRLLLMVVIPLVFSSLVVGVAGIGDVRRLGRVGLKTFLYTIVLSALSVVVGLTVVNTIRPGERISEATAQGLQARYGTDAAARIQATAAPPDRPVLTEVIETLIPTNPIAAIASPTPNLLHLMFFGLVLGFAATLVTPRVAAPFLSFLEGLYAVSAKIIDVIMKLAPYAVACLLFTNTSGFGLDLLGALLWFILTVLLGLAIQMFGIYSLSVRFLSGIRPLDFFRRIRTVMLTAFSTSSSNATLPTALRVSEENLNVPREINSFVLTVGATANQNGTALYEGVTVIFLAQLAGVDLSLGAQLSVAYLAILGGIGTAGVPSGSIPFIILILASIGVNPALIGIILGVDRILDMCRTTLNVTGDITAATYVARSEGFPLLDEVAAPA
ncbi:MAG: dicarboxylate/amino acid:cation symporter [Gemmatimonadetes bacterium]|nr:dicarboxylate/amino acid:cation symporter [Gemmatimonadota bacterium]